MDRLNTACKVKTTGVRERRRDRASAWSGGGEGSDIFTTPMWGKDPPWAPN